MNRRIKISWIWVIILALGIYIGQVIRKIPLVKFDNSIDLAEILNVLIAIITLVVAIHISHVLDRKKKKEEYIFEFLVRKVDDIKIAINHLNTTIAGDQVPIYVINSKLKSITLSYLDLKHIMKLMEVSINQAESDEIMALINHLKLLCTEKSVNIFGTNTIAYMEEVGLQVDNSTITYSTERREEISNFTKKILNKIFHLILK